MEPIKEFRLPKPLSDSKVNKYEKIMRAKFKEEGITELRTKQVNILTETIIKSDRRTTVSAVTIEGLDRGLIMKSSDGRNQRYHNVNEVIGVIKVQSDKKFVRLYDWWFDGEKIVELLEICPTTLEKFIEFIQRLIKKGSISLLERIAVSKVVLDRLLRGLGALHGFLICHRDYKGDNILITLLGELLGTDFDLAALLKRADELMNSDVGNEYYKKINLDPSESQVPPKLMPAADVPNLAALAAELAFVFKGGYRGDAVLSSLFFGPRYKSKEDKQTRRYLEYLLTLRNVENMEQKISACEEFADVAKVTAVDNNTYTVLMNQFLHSGTMLLCILCIENLTIHYPWFLSLCVPEATIVNAINSRKTNIQSNYVTPAVVKKTLETIYRKMDARKAAADAAAAAVTKQRKANTQATIAARETEATQPQTPRVRPTPSKTIYGSPKLEDEEPAGYKPEEVVGKRMGEKFLKLWKDPMLLKKTLVDDEEGDSSESDSEEDDHKDSDSSSSSSEVDNQAENSPTKEEQERALYDVTPLAECIQGMRDAGLAGTDLYVPHKTCPVCFRIILIPEDNSGIKRRGEMNNLLKQHNLFKRYIAASSYDPTYCDPICAIRGRKPVEVPQTPVQQKTPKSLKRAAKTPATPYR